MKKILYIHFQGRVQDFWKGDTFVLKRGWWGIDLLIFPFLLNIPSHWDQIISFS